MQTGTDQLSSMENFELTEEQKLLIAQNRQKALKRKVDCVEESRIAAAALAKDSLSCQCIIADTGQICGISPVAKDLLLTFGESCCDSCRHLTDDFGLINKSDVASQFLLPQDSIKMMKFSTKINPRNSGFAPMKLYLRKHAMEKSFKRWGDADGLLREIDRREKDRFDRGLADCKDALDLSRNFDVSAGGEFSNGGECSSVSDLLSRSKEDQLAVVAVKEELPAAEKSRGAKAKANSIAQKRSAQLSKMMLAIRDIKPTG